MPQHASATRPRTAPLHPRRVSGPTRRPAPAGAPTRGRTGAFERLSRIPDHRVVDRLLRSRACIWVIGIMLGGIVAMQVSLLRLNAGISRAVQTQTTLEMKNAELQGSISGLSSTALVRDKAADLSMIDPPAGLNSYLVARPDTDPARAAHRMHPPSPLARQIMAAGGVLPGTAPAPGATVAGAAGNTTAVATPAPTVAPAVAAIATPTATPPLPTPVPTASPAPTVTAAPGTGATAAPQG